MSQPNELPHDAREGPPSFDAVRSELKRVLESQHFRHASRLSELLSFVVESVLRGETDRLKETLLGVYVFDRVPGYDAKSDPIVRVTARRLRQKLVEYYRADGSKDPIHIGFPKGSYVPVFQRGPALEHPEPTSHLSTYSAKRATLAATALVLVVSLATAWRLTRVSDSSPAPLTRVTFDDGQNSGPAFSADGKFLAFASDRSGEGHLDIWLQQVGSREAVRLTRHSTNDYEPEFSPDGTLIAFRSDRSGGGIYVMPAMGGSERLIAARGYRPKFSPDGKLIAYSATASKSYIVAADGGQPIAIQPSFSIVYSPIWMGSTHRLLFWGKQDLNQSSSSEPDWWVWTPGTEKAVKTGAFAATRNHGLRGTLGMRVLPGFWSDKQKVVVFSGIFRDSTDLWELPLSPETGQVVGAPRRLTYLNSSSGLELFPASGPNGSIAFMSPNSEIGVWRVPIHTETGTVGRPLERVAPGAISPSVTADNGQMVYNKMKSSANWDVWLRNLHSGHEIPVAVTEEREQSPAISADGARIAYSLRPGSRIQIWSRDRPEPETVCHDCLDPQGWSSDGQYLLFSCTKERDRGYSIGALNTRGSREHNTIYESPRMNVNVGGVRISPDDKWVAFTRGSGDDGDLVLAPFRGTRPVPERDWLLLTSRSGRIHNVGWSPDGKLFYYLTNRDGFLCLWALRLDPLTKRPREAPFEAYPLHRAFGSPLLTPGAFGATMTRDHFYFSMGEMRGDIWILSRTERQTEGPFP